MDKCIDTSVLFHNYESKYLNRIFKCKYQIRSSQVRSDLGQVRSDLGQVRSDLGQV